MKDEKVSLEVRQSVTLLWQCFYFRISPFCFLLTREVYAAVRDTCTTLRLLSVSHAGNAQAMETARWNDWQTERNVLA
jgi:hypothetical protein